jgi:hypothetical protein
VRHAGHAYRSAHASSDFLFNAENLRIEGQLGPEREASPCVGQYHKGIAIRFLSQLFNSCARFEWRERLSGSERIAFWGGFFNNRSRYSCSVISTNFIAVDQVIGSNPTIGFSTSMLVISQPPAAEPGSPLRSFAAGDSL